MSAEENSIQITSAPVAAEDVVKNLLQKVKALGPVQAAKKGGEMSLENLKLIAASMNIRKDIKKGDIVERIFARLKKEETLDNTMEVQSVAFKKDEHNTGNAGLETGRKRQSTVLEESDDNTMSSSCSYGYEHRGSLASAANKIARSLEVMKDEDMSNKHVAAAIAVRNQESLIQETIARIKKTRRNLESEHDELLRDILNEELERLIGVLKIQREKSSKLLISC